MTLRILPLAIFLALPVFAQAQEARQALPQGLTLGVQGGYYRYSENPQFMSLTSDFTGAVTGAYQTDLGNMGLRYEGRFLYAPADYASASGKDTNETNYAFDGRVLLDKELAYSNLSFAPYIGLGYRALRNDGKDVNGFKGYTRISQYLYLPAGAWFGVPVNDGDMLLGQLEGGPLLIGEQYSDINSGLYNKQHTGEEFRMSAAYRTGKLQLGPYAQFWRIDASDGDCSGNFCGREPKNFTRELGMELSYHF